MAAVGDPLILLGLARRVLRKGEKVASVESIRICTAISKALALSRAIKSLTCISEPLMTLPVGASFTASAICSMIFRHSACMAVIYCSLSIVSSRSMASLLKRAGLQAGNLP